MSADEDTELRDLVAQTLESNGVLGKIRAQLRASVFLALEEQDTIQNKTPLLNQQLKKFISTKEGQLATSLVQEFLQFFNLKYSLAVFEPEVGIGNEYKDRAVLARELNVVEGDASSNLPLLAEIVKRGGGEKLSRTISNSSEPQSNSLHSVSHASSVESKNRKNSDSSKPQQPPSGSPKSSLSAPQPNHDGAGSDPEDDTFFDDLPLGKNVKFGDWAMGKKDSVEAKDITLSASSLGASGTYDNKMSSLAGLPPLMGGDNQASQKMAETEKEIKSIDKRMADLGFDMPEDYEDYDEDFESSNISPLGATPRSARSDQVRSAVEDIEEEYIEEDISVADDLLKSDHSGPDELTTDRTVSPAEQSAAFDYVEDILQP
ncbi:FGFR1 oncogene partner [Lamellibrachia satsuma]|nr:FGFR1 oncogene partner [Lamellibrachia satsuma]